MQMANFWHYRLRGKCCHIDGGYLLIAVIDGWLVKLGGTQTVL